jgi:hypothetical protein
MKKRANADSTSTGADEGWAVMTTLIGGFVLWGAVGWALDRWFGTHFLTPVGLLIGMALGIYAVVARHGGFRPPPPAGAPTAVRRVDPYNLQLYRRSRSISDPPSGPPPANPRRETECP